MKEIYDVITKQSIVLEKGKLIKQSKELGFNYSSLQKLFFGDMKHLLGRYILPSNKNEIFTLIDFETNEKFECITASSLRYYFLRPLTLTESRYISTVRAGRQKIASVAGRSLYLEGQEKTKRFRKTKYGGEKLSSLIIENKLRNKIANCVRGRIKIALKSNKKNKSRELIGCSSEFLIGYLSSKFTEGMSLENHGKWHIDHIKPLSSFNLVDVEQQKIACHYSNLQPLWARDNIIKGDKLN